MASEDWKTISQKKRESNASKIPAEWKLSKEILDKYDAESHQSVLDVPRTCGVLSEKEVEITEKYDATALLEKLAKKEMSSVEVVTAFCKRAAVAQQLVYFDVFGRIMIKAYVSTDQMPHGDVLRTSP